VGAKYASGEADQTIPGVVPFDQGSLDSLGGLRGIRMRYPETDHLWPWSQALVQQGKDSGLDILPPPNPLDRNHLSIGIEGEDRLDVEHPGQPRLTPGNAAGP
jgi:hypothetical protein